MDPQSWNAYAYVHNNPLKYTDPHGLTYQVCDSSGRNCNNLSDVDFESEERAGKSNGEHFSNGSLYHYGSNGGRISDGTYHQTDVDLTSPQFLAVQTGVNSSSRATISATQARALAQNVVDVLRVTAVAAATKGGPYVESLRRQLANPRFSFLDQIPGPLKEAIVTAAAQVGIQVK